jgi:hypothetical protein
MLMLDFCNLSGLTIKRGARTAKVIADQKETSIKSSSVGAEYVARLDRPAIEHV